MGKGLGGPPNSQIQGILDKLLISPSIEYLASPASLNLLSLASSTPPALSPIIPLTPFPASSGGSSPPAHVAATPQPSPQPTVSLETLLFLSGICPHEDRGKGHSSRLDATSESWPTVQSVTQNGYRNRQSFSHAFFLSGNLLPPGTGMASIAMSASAQS